MGFEPLGNDGRRYRYAASSAPGRYVDLVQEPGLWGRLGAGTIHHIAFRATDDDDQVQWSRRLADSGLQATSVRDRTYFHSIYFSEPGGVLFEIATDPPGFTMDEPLESLGQSLKLPSWLEKSRSEIEAALPPLE
jgi:glyoxalase family protein